MGSEPIDRIDKSTINLAERRRRTRLVLSVPLMVTSLDPSVKFQGVCETIDVSSSGAQLRLQRHLPPGIRLRLDVLNSNRMMTEARVVRSESDRRKGWRIGIQLLQQPGNFWGILSPPKDWDFSEGGDNFGWYG